MTVPGGGHRTRAVLAWALTAAGLLAYNWWVLVPFKPGLMHSPSELFSNLEVTGLPYATAMQHADLSSGLLLLAAFLVAGNATMAVPVRARSGRREWLAMMGFAIAGAVGGLYPEVCNDTADAACRRMEWRFQLPASQYVHIVAGIGEFTCITVALVYAMLRNRGVGTRTAGIYRGLFRGALVGYPLLGAAYLLNRLGGVMEGVFFTGFTVMVLAQIAERTSSPGDKSGQPPDGGVDEQVPVTSAS
jgi:branched-subunit amino acid permease